jgi:xanthine dehydrogenase accessory factor
VTGPEPVATMYETLRDCLRTASPAGLATVVSGPGTGNKLLVRPGAEPIGTLGDPELDRVAARDAAAELEAGRTGTRHYGPHGETIPADEANAATLTVFVESFAPPPTMVIFGAVDFTAALAKVAKVLGYRVIVCDAREVFATPRRFPMADEVVVDWPNRLLDRIGSGLGVRDAVCVLTHDPKFDVPAIQGALRSRVGYIGVMGSRKTHGKRIQRLVEVGITEPADLARLHAPIGLDLGARTPEETAVSICAEIIAQRTGRHAPALRDSTGPIH